MAHPAPPPTTIRDQIRAAVDADGVRRTARRLEVSDATVLRLLAGLPVQRGTVAAVRAAMEGRDG